MFCGQMGPIFAGADGFRNRITPLRSVADAKDVEPSGPKVLVVDDHKLIADTITLILQNAGFRADTAYDGCMALEMIARSRPDFLLSDVLMPRMNGVELAIAVRKIDPKARILLISGQAGISEILQEGQRQGFEFELLAKPFHPTKLIERLKEASNFS